MRRMVLALALGMAALLLWTAFAGPAVSAGPVTGAIFTSLEDGSRVNKNIYEDKRDVYLNGGPGRNAPITAAGLPDGNYYFQVTDPSGKVLLSTDPVFCREVRADGGIFVEFVSKTEGRSYTVGNGKNTVMIPCWIDGWQFGQHDLGQDIYSGSLTIQLMPYLDTPNKGGVYKAWVTPTGDFVGEPDNVDNPCGNGCFHGFIPAFSKTDNFKVKKPGKPFENPTITVRKFLDTDGDGVWDVGEPEVGVTTFIDGGGWPVHIADPNGITSDGYTPYTYLPGYAGNYIVSEDLLSGWGQTALYLDGVSKPVAPSVTVPVAFTSGETHEVVFGNFECFDVSGHKVNDLNGNGVWDMGEPGIAGWTIYLYRNGQLYATTTTDANGYYSFTVCVGGNFEVREATPPGWTPITATSVFFTASSGVDHPNVDFLNFECFDVSGYKIDDTDGDGVKDAGEPGLSGWMVELWRNGVLVATTTTGTNGYYKFTVCQPGSYVVKEVQKPGWLATYPESGQYTFTATSGLDRMYDFLNFKLGKICGYKFYDADHDGVWDASEVTIEGWKFELYKNGAYVATATTGADGKYCFYDLGPGTYEVREVMPLNPSTTMVWAQTFPGDDGDWDITATSGFSVTNANFGNVCEYTESRTWGYWKTHTGYDSPPKDPAYDLLPSHPMQVDIQTPEGSDKLISSAYEAKWLFDGAGSGDPPNCSGDCRSLFRVQLLALHMNLLKFTDMGDAVYVYPGDAYSGQTVQDIYDAALALLNDGQYHDFTSFQNTLDRINNNHNYGTGSHVLVCPEPQEPIYP